MYLRLHGPCRLMPDGRPALLVTMVDNQVGWGQGGFVRCRPPPPSTAACCKVEAATARCRAGRIVGHCRTLPCAQVAQRLVDGGEMDMEAALADFMRLIVRGQRDGLVTMK